MGRSRFPFTLREPTLPPLVRQARSTSFPFRVVRPPAARNAAPGLSGHLPPYTLPAPRLSTPRITSRWLRWLEFREGPHPPGTIRPGRQSTAPLHGRIRAWPSTRSRRDILLSGFGGTRRTGPEPAGSG